MFDRALNTTLTLLHLFKFMFFTVYKDNAFSIFDFIFKGTLMQI